LKIRRALSKRFSFTSRSGTPISAISVEGCTVLGPNVMPGIVLWSLSIAAADWQTSEKLTRLCTIPVNEVLQATWDTGSLMMEARILRPLLWFGLLDHRAEKVPDTRFAERHLYRKTPLFDRFVTFNVRTDPLETVRH
jgi:hypothetical protein